MFDDTPLGIESKVKSSARSALLLLALSSISVIVFCIYFFQLKNLPPIDFPTEAVITIRSGLSVDDIASSLAESGVIQSPVLFKLVTVFSGSAESLRAGRYRFPHPLTQNEIIEALRSGLYANESVILTIPEGTRVSGIDAIIHNAFPHIAEGAFIAIASSSEGYLFPDTYHLTPNATAFDIFTLMSATFDERVKPLFPDEDKRDLAKIVTIASLLEREGNSRESMEIISGIIYKRMKLGMPLQVDATLEYERGKGSSELSLEDLQIDSPYNTYTNKGLPPTPIANSGLMALAAAQNPLASPYLYYLTGKDGVFYYANTFEEHKRNKARYLR